MVAEQFVIACRRAVVTSQHSPNGAHHSEKKPRICLDLRQLQFSRPIFGKLEARPCMKKILLIDDSEDIAVLVKTGLENYIVQHATTVADGTKALADSIDLVLIDVSLPDGNGFELCSDLSRDLRYKNVPKILLTGKVEISDKVFGFNCGANDYITKPFSILELKARVDRYLARGNESADETIVHSSFAFEMSFQKCFFIENNQKVDLQLTPTEFRLFFILVKNEGQVLSRQALEHAVWEANGTFIQVRGIDTHIAHLRKKLDTHSECIVSVYGQGYSFQSKVAETKSS
jgi:two-component system, OmpR family, alkaline phosphatase synthesis response regulator PhoP